MRFHSQYYIVNTLAPPRQQVALVVDDIYFAFRTPELLSANYFVHPDTNAPLRPDVIILGKALAAGYPLSAVGTDISTRTTGGSSFA